MQVRQINTVNSPKQLRQNKNIQKNINNTQQQSPSFKGGLDSFCLGLANAIENGGLFVSFTLQDMLGTNLPRPIMGLRRNSKENEGKANKSFAAKELVREMLTGPSMFLIPMGLLKAGKPIFGETIDVPMKHIKAFGDVHAERALNSHNNPLTKKEFYANAFEEMIRNAKNEGITSDATRSTAAAFADKLEEALKTPEKAPIHSLKDFKANMAAKKSAKATSKKLMTELSDDFVAISKKYATDAATSDFTTTKIRQASGSFKDTVGHLVSYADDIIPKVSDKAPNEIQEAIKKLTNKKVLGRLANNAAMYAAVIAFLWIIPKLYNKAEGEGNSGLKGLMKEETLNDKTLNSNEKKNTNVLQSKIDKSNPSFGSSASFADKAVSGIMNSKKIHSFEFAGCNVSFPMLLGIMGLGVLLPRTIQAKDDYDKEEILRRDLVTCATMCFAEKELQKGFSKLNEVRSGFVLAAKDSAYKNKSFAGKVFDYLRPIKGINVLSTDQIVSKYSNIDQYRDGIKGFCDFISGQGGQLNKVFSIDGSKGATRAQELVESLLKKEGTTLAKADNAKITETLDKARNSAEVKELVSLFKDKNNPWVKKAKTLNARFTALSVLVLVPVFLGFLLPAINEKATKKRIKEEQEAKAIAKAQKLASINTSMFTNQSQNVFNNFKA